MKQFTYSPEPHALSLSTLITEVEKGIIKIPQFQRDFVWSKQKSADLLDSVLKGYPIGTFIFWKTKEELRDLRNIGGIDLPKTPKGDFIQYVLDGQQRLTSLFAAVKGLVIKRDDDTKEDFSKFYVDLESDTDEALVVVEMKDNSSDDSYITFNDLLFGKLATYSKFPEKFQEVIQAYKDRLNSYQFPTVTMKEAPIDVATDVFTRLNVSGKELSVFEIMVAKTFDADKRFDLSQKYDELIQTLEGAGYGTLPNSTILQAVSICITKEARKKSILRIKKRDFINAWNPVKEAIHKAVDYLRSKVGVPVSQLLPYPSLIVPFTYYFYKAHKSPDAATGRLLQDFFWRAGLGERYSRSLDSNLAQDVKTIEAIVRGEQPDYDWVVDVRPQYIIDNGQFSTGRAYIKTLLCLLASKQPLSLRDNSAVNINNDWLARSNSRNYHHFFPKDCFKGIYDPNKLNHVLNITLVDDQLNKTEIRTKPPSKYIAHFEKTNPDIEKALKTHCISLEGFGIRDDDYDECIAKRAECFSKSFRQANIEPKTEAKAKTEEIASFAVPSKAVAFGSSPRGGRQALGTRSDGPQDGLSPLTCR